MTILLKTAEMLACSAENTEGLTGWEESKNLTKNVGAADR